LSGGVAKMFKQMWLRGSSPLRDADVGIYAGRIYRDVMMLRPDKAMVSAAIDAVFNVGQLVDMTRVHSDRKIVGESYTDALVVQHPELAEHLDSIDGLLDRAKAVAAKGAKAVTGKAASGLASKASSVATAAQRVPLGQYSIDRFATNMEAALRVYVWMRKNYPETVAKQMVDFVVFFIVHGRLRLLATEVDDPAQFSRGLEDLRSVAGQALAANDAKSKLQPKWEPVPVEMPQTCPNYDHLAIDLYGMIMTAAAGTDASRKKLTADIERVFMRLAPKYRKDITYSFMLAVFVQATDPAGLQ